MKERFFKSNKAKDLNLTKLECFEKLHKNVSHIVENLFSAVKAEVRDYLLLALPE